MFTTLVKEIGVILVITIAIDVATCTNVAIKMIIFVNQAIIEVGNKVATMKKWLYRMDVMPVKEEEAEPITKAPTLALVVLAAFPSLLLIIDFLGVYTCLTDVHPTSLI